VEQGFILQSLIEFLVRLGERDIKHRDERLLNPRCTVVKGSCEVPAGEGSEDGREQGSVELTNVRDRNRGRDAESLIGHSIVDMEEQCDHVEIGEGAASADRLSCDVFNRLASVEAHDLVFSCVEALDHN